MVHHRAIQFPKEFAFNIVVYEEEVNKVCPTQIHFLTGNIVTDEKI